jgi:hypothetical protein
MWWGHQEALAGIEDAALRSRVPWRAVPVTRASMPRSSTEDTALPTGTPSAPEVLLGKMLCRHRPGSSRLDIDLTGEGLRMQSVAGRVDFDRGFNTPRFVISGLPAKGSAKYGEHLKSCFQGQSLRPFSMTNRSARGGNILKEARMLFIL